ncbi:MAG: PHP domain-containing protein, partial [Alkalispirochaeta sp.]
MNARNNQRVDLHFHTMLSRKLPFSAEHLHAMLDEAAAAGIETIAVTDHIESPDYQAVRTYLADSYPVSGDGFDVAGVNVLTGAEVETSQDVHVLLYGKNVELDEMHRRMLPLIRRNRYPTVEELFSLSRSLDLLKVWAHPFRFVGGNHTPSLAGILDDSLVDGFDAIDLNAKDLFLHGIEMFDLVLDAAGERGLPVIGGSDAHHPSPIGSVYNECDGSITSYAALR